jgi:hypothetical protein
MAGLAPTGCWDTAWLRLTGLAYGWLPLVPDNLPRRNEGVVDLVTSLVNVVLGVRVEGPDEAKEGTVSHHGSAARHRRGPLNHLPSTRSS